MRDLLISGSGAFLKYITQRAKEKFEVGRSGENDATYLGMRALRQNEDSEWVVLDPNGYEDKINHIGISHERMMNPDEILTENEQTALRSELGKLMWIARIARHDAIYDASAAAQTFSVEKMEIFIEEEGEEEKEVQKIEEELPLKEEEEFFDHMPDFANFKLRRLEANKANILKKGGN